VGTGTPDHRSEYEEKKISMPSMTRRTLFAATAATLVSAGLPEAVAAENGGESVFHVFAFQWKEGATEADKERATKAIRAFQGMIPGLLQTHVGPNLSPRGNGYTFGGIMQFTNKAALDAYVQHPSHQALLKWLVPLIVAVELDLQA
jgi:hypothetical protein